MIKSDIRTSDFWFGLFFIFVGILIIRDQSFNHLTLGRLMQGKQAIVGGTLVILYGCFISFDFYKKIYLVNKSRSIDIRSYYISLLIFIYYLLYTFFILFWP